MTRSIGKEGIGRKPPWCGMAFAILVPCLLLAMEAATLIAAGE